MSGDFAAASAYLVALKSLALQAPEKEESPRTTEYLQTMAAMLEAAIAQGRGQLDVALTAARQAAAIYDAMPFDFGPPASFKPPHELAGEILLQANRPKEAVAEFDAALKQAPLRSLAMQGRAKALAGVH
jgi:predicted Zn-dependent protease